MKNLLIGISILTLLTGCEKVLMDKNPGADPESCFESLWQTVHDKYSYFELKNINWDSVYAHYAPMVDERMTDEQLFSVLDSILYDLRDGHVNLVAPFNLSRNWSWYLNYPQNFDYDVIERHYLGGDYQIAGGMNYRMIDSVAYIYYGSFGRGFTEENLNEVMRFLSGTKGLIMDVRNNGGGSLGLVFQLASRFVREKRELLLTMEKTGPGPSDFGNQLNYSISPSSGINYSGSVILLTNRRCYSATNTFAAVMSQLDHVKLIGDQTGGGGGLPVDYELPNGWRYRFSATRSLIRQNGELYDIELGIPPDTAVSTDPQRMAQGKDDILETALDLLR